MDYRIEKDSLGEKAIPKNRYYGIHTLRAMENFKLPGPSVNKKIILELLLVKKACAEANSYAGLLPPKKAEAIMRACDDFLSGLNPSGPYEEEFPVSSLQGGAGTSTNMNVNECVANRAIELLDGEKGDYSLLHPLDDVNMSQSTNDVFPTAVRIAAIRLIRDLSEALADLQDELQKKEIAFSAIPRLGRTELMDALPMRAGQGFGAYAQAIARDRWRIYKSEERLRMVNIGGTAIGTGLNAPLKYIYRVTDNLRRMTGLGLSRAESAMDVTQNADVFVEVSGLLKALCVNLLKIAGDLRLLGSGPAGGLNEVLLPQLQAGSSIMPGKVNPVIPEMVTQVALKAIANDNAITGAASLGQLELNAFMPLIAESLLESLDLLCEGVELFNEKCIRNIAMNEERCVTNLEHSTAQAAGLIARIGYDKASLLAKKAAAGNKPFRAVVEEENLFSDELLQKLFSLNETTSPGIPGNRILTETDPKNEAMPNQALDGGGKLFGTQSNA